MGGSVVAVMVGVTVGSVVGVSVIVGVSEGVAVVGSVVWVGGSVLADDDGGGAVGLGTPRDLVGFGVGPVGVRLGEAVAVELAAAVVGSGAQLPQLFQPVHAGLAVSLIRDGGLTRWDGFGAGVKLKWLCGEAMFGADELGADGVVTAVGLLGGPC